MAYVATMGAHSCATIAIGGHKGVSKEANEAFIAEGSDATPEALGAVNNFYSSVLYPTKQDLGKTPDFCFENLMKAVDKSSLKSKYIVTVLNAHQQNIEKYWPAQLKKWGFEMVDATKNSIGSINYIYTRSKSRVPMPKDAK